MFKYKLSYKLQTFLDNSCNRFKKNNNFTINLLPVSPYVHLNRANFSLFCRMYPIHLIFGTMILRTILIFALRVRGQLIKQNVHHFLQMCKKNIQTLITKLLKKIFNVQTPPGGLQPLNLEQNPIFF